MGGRSSEKSASKGEDKWSFACFRVKGDIQELDLNDQR